MKRNRGSNQYRDKLGLQKHHKAIIVALLLSMLILFIIGRIHREEINWWRGVYEKSPILLAPAVEAVEPTPTPPLSKEQIIKRSKYPKEIDHIWEKETTRGRNNKDITALHMYCRAQGKTNEFGYGGMAMMLCFDTFEESVRAVEKWLDKRMAENLCYYNKGERVSDCEYVK